MPLLLAFAIGVVAGLRTVTAPAAVSWAARLGWLNVTPTGFAFLGYAYTPWIFTVLAFLEFIGDQMPSTPSRKVPMQFGARIVSGAFCGAAIGAVYGSSCRGSSRASSARSIGTLGGAAFRGRLAKALRQRYARGLHRGRHRDRRRPARRGVPAMTRFDAIIIGAGQAGPSLARRLTDGGHDRRVRRAPAQFGGTCVNTGCMPTKTLVASAYAAHLARRAAEYGVVIPAAAAPSAST